MDHLHLINDLNIGWLETEQRRWNRHHSQDAAVLQRKLENCDEKGGELSWAGYEILRSNFKIVQNTWEFNKNSL